MNSNTFAHSTQHDISGAQMEPEGVIAAEDSESIIQRGGQAIEAMGNDLGAAASGVFTEVDIDEARQRLRDAQASLVALGYSLSDSDDPSNGVDGVWSPACRDVVEQFQDENDLDATGRLDRETYETLMRSFEQAMSVQSFGGDQDDMLATEDDEAAQDDALQVVDGAEMEEADGAAQALGVAQDDIDNGVLPDGLDASDLAGDDALSVEQSARERTDI